MLWMMLIENNVDIVWDALEVRYVDMQTIARFDSTMRTQCVLLSSNTVLALP